MNHIAKLQSEAARQKARADALESGLHDMWVYLTSNPKFGWRPVVDGDGLPVAEPAERMDWISVSEAATRLNEIARSAQAVADEFGA
jgi:hypothetical protein